MFRCSLSYFKKDVTGMNSDKECRNPLNWWFIALKQEEFILTESFRLTDEDLKY